MRPSAERIVRSTVRRPASQPRSQFSPDGSALYVAERGERRTSPVAGWRTSWSHRVRPPARETRRRAAAALGGHTDPGRPASRRARRKRTAYLFVADSDDDDVASSTVTRNGSSRARASRSRAPGAFGTSPNALTLDGDRLYVSCGAANAIAGLPRRRLRGLTPLGAIPTGWYPTAVAVDRAHGVLYIADGKGESGSRQPARVASRARQRYGLHRRQSRRLDPAARDPRRRRARAGLTDVRDLAQHESVPPSAIVRRGGPIKHVIYVIKENRSYDQVLGDIAQARTVIRRWCCSGAA
jgi:hypothetical protein